MSNLNTRVHKISAAGNNQPALQGLIPSRDTINNKGLPVGFGWELAPTRTIPRMGDGEAADMGHHVHLHSQLRDADHTRVPKPLNGVDTYRDMGSFVPNVAGWQQADFRPIEPINSRFQVRDGDFGDY
ncbi:hypothetical protein QKT49_gp385 [Acanthamoeba castellanii medusavirus]|jgi:hypothetical protein|uniref:Uncharacterized protein n=1 Tax=Acanthamoeba castellanii medusavirus J1 TaxID=3114988 RepID=A0A3T1CX33_9VIRU|nr:hypothetical protein QKT49_gp385 [Acanthamoeba castellanii medusavirus]BBI30378.1 hypothetical protein [Acanthamoeba castellanii medusavirus J1]